MPGEAAAAAALTAVDIGTAVASALDLGGQNAKLIDAAMPGMLGPIKLWKGHKAKSRKKLGRDHEYYYQKFQHWIGEKDDNGWKVINATDASNEPDAAELAKQNLDSRNKVFVNDEGWSKIPCIPCLYLTMTPSEYQDLMADSESVTVHKMGYKIVGCQGYEKETVDGKVTLKPSSNFGYQVYSDRDLYTTIYESSSGTATTGLGHTTIHGWLSNKDMTQTEWTDGDVKTLHELKPLNPSTGDTFLRTYCHSLGAQYGVDLWEAFAQKDKYFTHKLLDLANFGKISQYRAGDTGHGECWNFGNGLDMRLPSEQTTYMDVRFDSYAVPKTCQKGFWKFNDGFQLTPFTWLNCRDKSTTISDSLKVKHSVSGNVQDLVNMEGLTKVPRDLVTQEQMTPQWIRLNSLNKDLVPANIKRMMKFEIIYYSECSSTGIDLKLNPLPRFGVGMEPEPGASIIVGSSSVTDNLKSKLRNQYKNPRIISTHTSGPRALSLYHWGSNIHPGTIKRPTWKSRMHTRIRHKRRTQNGSANEIADDQTNTSGPTFLGFCNY